MPEPLVSSRIMMKILAVDTTTPINAVAVCEGERLIAETIVRCGRKHCERLLKTVDWALEEAGLALADLDALAVSIGPGSFTGVRVGAAACKGLALAAGLPLVPVPTLDALARLVPLRDGLVCAMLDAKMKEVFGAVYRFEAGVPTKLTPDRVCPAEAVFEETGAPDVFIGDGAERYRERLEAAAPQALFLADLANVPRASAVAFEAAQRMAQGVNADPAAVAPIYLRKSQAEQLRAASAAPDS